VSTEKIATIIKDRKRGIVDKFCENMIKALNEGIITYVDIGVFYIWESMIHCDIVDLSDEIQQGWMRISHCPFCGEKLESEE
jgi:hypothetical protein